MLSVNKEMINKATAEIMKWRVDYVVGNTYKVKCVEAKTNTEAIKKAKVKNIVDLNPVDDMEAK